MATIGSKLRPDTAPPLQGMRKGSSSALRALDLAWPCVAQDTKLTSTCHGPRPEPLSPGERGPDKHTEKPQSPGAS